MTNDLIGDALVLAAGLTAGYFLRRRRTVGASGVATSPVPQPITTAAERPATEQHQRLHVIGIRCEHLDHMPGHVPAATVKLSTLSRDLRSLQRLGWGGNTHTNLCHYHNLDGRIGLELLHILCSTPGCGERTTILAGRATSGFGRLRNAGWTNLNGGCKQACPYCSGRRRPRW